MGVRGGGGGGLAPLARTPMLFSYGHPSWTTGPTKKTIWQPDFIRKWKPPEMTTCKPGLTQAFLQVVQQAISLIKPVLHI